MSSNNIKPHRVKAIIEDVRSLYNVGSMFRTADCAGIERLYLCGYTGCPPRKEIDKTALGADKMVPWEHHADSVELAKSVVEQGYQLLALEHRMDSQSIWDIELKDKICLAFGNELGGLSPGLIEVADATVHLPLYGLKTSMNVSVAFGVAVYEVVKRLTRET